MMAHASKTGGLMRSLHLLTVVIISLAAAASAAAQSQITTAVIDGTVVDASGAVLPGVEVEIRNADTNLTRTLTTDREGRFVALQLPPGRYTITLKLSGFATVVQEGVVVTVGETVRLSPTMKLSGIAETVTVTTTSPAVETTRTTAASTLDETTIENTPILGRKFEDLLTLTPGVSIVQGPDGDEITFAGQRGVFNNISLDGGDYNNGFFGEQMGGQRAAIDITLEAVKEFQVVATGANAEYGRNARGQNEGLPVEHKINNNALLAKVDWNLTSANNLSASYNFDFSKNRNQTFDVPTYGSSANGTEGPSKINILNVNLFSTVTTNK